MALRDDRLAKAAEKSSRLQARADVQEAKRKAEERKARNKRRWANGDLVEVGGLAEWPKRRLLGLMKEASSADEKTRARYDKIGQEMLDRLAADAAKIREPLIVIFPEAIPQLSAGALTQAGLRWRKKYQQWEGDAVYSEVMTIASAHHGHVRRTQPQEEDTEMPLAAE